jgi:hypothetical protein
MKTVLMFGVSLLTQPFMSEKADTVQLMTSSKSVNTIKLVEIIVIGSYKNLI